MTVTTERGTTEKVPGFFQFQNNQMSIWVNPGDIENHFGPTTPIQGMIINPELLCKRLPVSYPQVYNQVFNKTAVVRTVDRGVALRTVQ